MAWLAFAVVDGRFLAGLALWDIKSDVLLVSTRAGRLAAKVQRDDCRAIARLLLQALETHA
jgi:hypothetical protein